MTFSHVLTSTAEGYVLINRAVVADDRSFSDNNAHTVVNKYSFSELSGRVDLNSGLMPVSLRKVTSDKFHVVVKEPVRASVAANGLVTRIEQHDLKLSSCGGISLHNGVNVRFHSLKQINTPLRQYRTIQVCGSRSQIFRQADGIICKQGVRRELSGVALNIADKFTVLLKVNNTRKHREKR